MDSTASAIRAPAQAALSRLTAWFGSRPTRQGVVARRLVGVHRGEEHACRAALLQTWSEDVRADGSVGGGALPTIWRIQELMDLGLENSPHFARHVAWVVARQDLPGAYSEGCVATRHRVKACGHFLGGFFSPAPPGVTLTPITMPTGKTFRAEPAARFAVSCLALQTLLAAGVRSLPIDRHLDSLALLTSEFADWDGYFAPDLAASAFGALASSTVHPDANGSLAAIFAMNQVEGTWRNGDLFHFLNALLRSTEEPAFLALRRAVPAMLQRQRSDGSFGGGANEERSLIALRVLIAVTRR